MTPARRFRIALAGGIGIVALEAVWLRMQLGGPRWTQAFSDTVDLPVITVAVAACIWTSRRESGRTRAGWLLLGAGLASWGVGEAIWTYYEFALGVEVPFPSLADAGFLGLIPLTGWGMLLLPSAPSGRAGRTRAILDGLIITTSIFAVSWATLLGPMYRAGSESVAEMVLGLAYPFGDAFLIGVVLFVSARARGKDRVTMSLIGTGLVALALADSIFTYQTLNDTYFTGGLVDVGWTLGFVLIGLSALRPAGGHTTADDKPSSVAAAVLPYAAIIVGLPIVVVRLVRTGTMDPVVFAVGVALFVVVSARQYLVIMENSDLARDRDAKVKERTAELEGTLTRLAEARRLQDEFVSNATHELRTPLTILMGSLDTIAQPADAIAGDAPMLVDMAREGARRMNELVDDLLLASGIEERHGWRPKPFDTSDQVRDALSELKTKDKTLESRLPAGAWVMGDASRFRKALGHVLSNADKFGPGGSTISVEVTKDATNVSVVVRDEGPGIPRHLRELVFERFYQADGSDTPRHGGMGLGLYLARGVVRTMGGDVTIDDVRRGCAVRITLPTAEASGVVVDDDPESRVRGAQGRLDVVRRSA